MRDTAGRRFVARRSSRAPEALTWEIDILEFLAAQGFAVSAQCRPPTEPTRPGRIMCTWYLTFDHAAPIPGSSWCLFVTVRAVARPGRGLGDQHRMPQAPR